MLGRSFRSNLRFGSTRRRISSVTPTTSTSTRLLTSSLRSSSSSSASSASRFAYPEGMKAYEDDWVDTPEYPEITETHTWNEHRRARLQKILDFRDTIKNASSPEEKNFNWNYPRRFGYKTFWVTEDNFEYDSLKMYKFITRTRVASTTELPSQYSSPELEEKVEYFKNKLKGPLQDVLAFELEIRRSYENDFNEFPHTIDHKRSQTLVSQINRVILSVLGEEIDYLRDCQVDHNPNVQAFWHLGGTEAPSALRSKRKGSVEAKGRTKARYIQPDDPIESNIQYIGKSLLQLRSKDPPPNYLDISDPLCQRSLEEFPDRFPHHFKAYGFKFAEDYRFASFIPGHWSGDEFRCNLLSYHPRSHLLDPRRASNTYWSAPEEQEEALLSQAILSSFGRLLSQAFYHGFDQFTDIDYPFSTQTVITNGLDYSFYSYQLNTLKFDQLSLPKNPKQNIIWSTPTQSIMDPNPEAKGQLNDLVLSNLLKFYLNPPQKIASKNPTPYLGLRLQDWEDDYERTKLFFNWRNMISQRIYEMDALLRLRPPEIYEYERIYKLWFNAMPMERRLKHFEMPSGFPGSDPYNEPFKLHDPLRISKGKARLFAEVQKKKEEEEMKAAQIAEAEKYGMNMDTRSKRFKKPRK